MGDREKVIKGLQELHGSKETMKLITDAIALLKKQPEIVRCKDCIKRRTDKCALRQTGDQYLDLDPDDDWFCADGEVKQNV